jgi:serine/threonine protein kinase
MDRIGRYKIVRELGRGAMGVVYHAIDPNIGRPVAIKTIQFAPTRKPEEMERMRERLFREARSAGILSHPGIVTIYDVDQHDDMAFIAMEFVDGQTLDQMLSDGAMPPERLFSILGQTAVALDYAHSKGIVHRDIKPANIMVTRDGTTKITDFGIAKITASESLTMTGSIVGTPHYMSPEQVQGQAVDGRSDQFSLAVIAYEMLTGEKPYTGEHLTTVVYKIVAEEPASPRRLNPTLSVAIDAALRKGLAKRPDLRYKSCQEFAHSLEQACAASQGWKPMPRTGMLDEPTVAVAMPAATLPPPRRTRQAEATSTTTGEGRRAGFGTFLLAMMFVAGLLALIGWQAAPWLMPPRNASHVPEAAASPAQSQPSPVPPSQGPASQIPTSQGPASQPQSTPEAVPPLPVPVAATSQDNAKPSPLGPPPKSEPARQSQAPVRADPQEVLVLTSPAGARASLDGDPANSCATPCKLQALPGKHRVALSAPGYQIALQEIVVGDAPIELAPVSLSPVGGKLMLNSIPEGAAVSLNGKPTGKTTPAELVLPPGIYAVTLDLRDLHGSDKVEIKDTTKFLKIKLVP